MSQYYVYAYLNPLEIGKFESSIFCFLAKPFYIGKGIGNRLYDHLKEARPTRKFKNSHKLNTIRYIQQFNQHPIIIKICENLTEKQALSTELKLISELKQKYNLTNIRMSNWISENKKFVQEKRKFNNPRKDTITIFNKIFNEHVIIKISDLSLYQQTFGKDNIINTSQIKFREGSQTKMARIGTANGMYGKSAVKGKKWCIINGEEKLLMTDQIDDFIKLNYNVQYGRLYKPLGKRIIFEGELKGKYRNETDISNNPCKKYQYGLVWSTTKPTFLNHKQI